MNEAGSALCRVQGTPFVMQMLVLNALGAAHCLGVLVCVQHWLLGYGNTGRGGRSHGGGGGGGGQLLKLQ